MAPQKHFCLSSISLQIFPSGLLLYSCARFDFHFSLRCSTLFLSVVSTSWLSLFLSTWLWLPKSRFLWPCLCNCWSSADSFLFYSCILYIFPIVIFGKMCSSFQHVTLFPKTKDPTQGDSLLYGINISKMIDVSQTSSTPIYQISISSSFIE